MQRSRELLHTMFDVAIAAAQPARRVSSHLPAKPRGRLVVVGAGKASAAMAKAVEDHWYDDLSGFVVTRYGYAVRCERVEIFESAHPVPDAKSFEGAQKMLATVHGLTSDDIVLCLMSGGASSLLAAPIQGLTR